MTRLTRHRSRTLIPALALCAGAALAVVPAAAHSDLVRSEPEYNAALVGAPGEAVLTFDEAVDLSAATVDLTGNPAPSGKPKASYGSPDHLVIKVGLPALRPGRHILSWYFLSAVDGHVIGGELPFAVKRAAGNAAVAPPAAASEATESAPAPAVVPEAAPVSPPVGNGAFAPSRVPAAPPAALSPPAGETPASPAPPAIPGEQAGAKAGIEAELAVPAQEMNARQAAAAAAAVAPLRPKQSAGLAALASITRAAGYAGLLVLVGGLLFVVFLWPQGAGLARTRRLLWSALATGAGTTLVTMGTVGAALRGRSALAAFSPATAADTLGTTVGNVLTVRLALIGAAGVVLAGVLGRPERTLRVPWRIAGAATGLGALATYGMTGHPRAGGAAASVASFVHLGAGAVWFGGLTVLAAIVLPRREPAEAAPIVRRFSGVAFVAVCVMATTGAALVLLVGPGLGEVIGTGYGTALIVKLVLVALVIAAAQRSRRFTRRLVSQPQLKPLVLPVALEVALALGVLSATAALVGRSPSG